MRLLTFPLACLIASWISGATSQYSQQAGSWLGWGGDVFNNRWAAPGSTISTSDANTPVETCSQSYAHGVSATAVIQNGIAYYPTWSGVYVALDYTTCKVLWTVNVTAFTLANGGPFPFQYISSGGLSRTSAAIDGNVLYFGTQAHALLVAVNKNTGAILGHTQINPHPLAVITQSPTVWNGIVYVGASSQEETASGVVPGYKCCSFIGNFAAFKFNTGSDKFTTLWNQTMAPASSGFTGIGVWGGQPSIDPTKNQVFIATGNIYTLPDSASKCENQTRASSTKSDPCIPSNVYAEAVMAFDQTSGHINWVSALGPVDAWNLACNTGQNPGNCPPSPGPDADFGMAPSFVPGGKGTPGGHDTIVVGQKNGYLYAFNAQSGGLFWVNPTSPDGLAGGLIWGLAVDDTAVYYTAANTNQESWKPMGSSTNITNSAFGAANLATGKNLWQTQVPGGQYSECVPSIVNDVVLNGRTGTLPPGANFPMPSGTGGIVAMNKQTGKILKDLTLDTIFYGNIAIVGQYAMFGTGYTYGSATGTFQVWKA